MLPGSRLVLFAKGVIFALAGLLVGYHAYTLFELYVGSGVDFTAGPGASRHLVCAHSRASRADHWQPGACCHEQTNGVVWHGPPSAAWSSRTTGRTSSIFRFLSSRGGHPLSFLKGFIIPTVITLLYLSTNAQRNHPGTGQPSHQRT